MRKCEVIFAQALRLTWYGESNSIARYLRIGSQSRYPDTKNCTARCPNLLRTHRTTIVVGQSGSLTLGFAQKSLSRIDALKKAYYEV
jgi:hypothetical protein